MRLLAAALLLFSLAMLWYFVRRDLVEYAAFKLLTNTADRQRKYLYWLRKSFLRFTGTTVISLAILGRLRTVITLPPEFAALSQRLRAIVPSGQISSSFLLGLCGAVVVGLIAGIVLVSVLAKKSKRNMGRPIMIGDVQALLPRNGPETVCTALLSLNAGLSEELFFRLLLPLLFTTVTGNPLAAFVISGIIFGLVHFYQGPAGVLGTTLIGFVLAAVYLLTGSLWIVICAHAGLNSIGLVVRPTILRAVAARHALRNQAARTEA